MWLDQRPGDGDECLPPQAPLTRNRTIARLCQVLIACPESSVEPYPSGSWHCLRHAERLGKPVVLLPRDSEQSPDLDAVMK